jgi:hypothetical protein
MMNKRGQFFLVAALVIVGILIGLAGVYTQVNTPKEDSAVYDLSSELNYESLQVIDQGVYTDTPQDQVNKNILDLADYYVDKNPQKDFAIIYGDRDTLTVLAYTVTPVGSVSTSTGGTTQSHTVSQTILRSSSGDDDSSIIGDYVVVKFKGQTYSFKLGAGTSFYSVLSSQSGNQQYVAADGNTAVSAAGSCTGRAPHGSHIFRMGPAVYPAGYPGVKSWTHIDISTVDTANSALTFDPCKWSCNINYINTSANECTRI